MISIVGDMLFWSANDWAQNLLIMNWSNLSLKNIHVPI